MRKLNLRSLTENSYYESVMSEGLDTLYRCEELEEEEVPLPRAELQTLRETLSCRLDEEGAKSIPLTGELRLQYYVLLSALNDIVKGNVPMIARNDSFAWVFALPPYGCRLYQKHIFSFPTICDTLEVDGARIRSLLRDKASAKVTTPHDIRSDK